MPTVKAQFLDTFHGHTILIVMEVHERSVEIKDWFDGELQKHHTIALKKDEQAGLVKAVKEAILGAAKIADAKNAQAEPAAKERDE